ncbi:MAG: hypothetical protein LBF12_06975 [Christensenellaceae bacterium]|jgi:hypothetical protein|nr:hypothetical protein [Christensenellaceae bacterium]
MVFKLQKNICDLNTDYTLTSITGEAICKLSHIKNGLIVTNSRNQQLAKVTYSPSIARISIAHVQENDIPTCIIIERDKNGLFYITREVNAKESSKYLLNIPEFSPRGNITIWGKPSDYSFDIYEGPELSANIVPNLDDDTHFMLNLNYEANVIQMLLIVLSIETLNSLSN